MALVDELASIMEKYELQRQAERSVLIAQREAEESLKKLNLARQAANLQPVSETVRAYSGQDLQQQQMAQLAMLGQRATPERTWKDEMCDEVMACVQKWWREIR